MSEKTVAQKLRIKEHQRVLLVNEPQGYKQSIGQLPPNVSVMSEPKTTADIIQLFVTSRSDLEKNLGKLKTLLAPSGAQWVTYPKRTSKIKSDINRDTIYEYAQSIGLQGIAMISVDDTWSALRLKIV